MGVNAAAATAMLAKGDLGARTSQQIGELGIGRRQQAATIAANRDADARRWLGDKSIMSSSYFGQWLRDGGQGGGRGSTLRGYAGRAIEIGGGTFGLYEQRQSIDDRAAGQTRALDEATGARILNQRQAQQGLIGNQDAYQQQMSANHQQYAKDLSEAASISANQSAGGVNRGASVQITAINSGTGMELEGNRMRYEAQVKAAEVTRGAAIEAARLHAMERVLGAISHKIARDLERGFELRF